MRFFTNFLVAVIGWIAALSISDSFEAGWVAGIGVMFVCRLIDVFADEASS